jgi:hypothetical protein
MSLHMSLSVWVTGADRERVEATADAIAARLATREVRVEVLDSRTPGAEALTGAGGDRCALLVAEALGRHGVATVVALSLAAHAARAAGARMIEVHVRGGDRPGYEPAERPEVEIDGPAGVERVVGTLEVLGLLARGAERSYTEDEEREVIRRLKAFGYL